MSACPGSAACRPSLRAGALIALVAVVAATWATVNATTVAVQEEQQESLHADAQAYDALVGYAATHGSWSDAQALVDRLARQQDGAVTVTDTTGRVLVGSGEGTEPLRPRAGAGPDRPARRRHHAAGHRRVAADRAQRRARRRGRAPGPSRRAAASSGSWRRPSRWTRASKTLEGDRGATVYDALRSRGRRLPARGPASAPTDEVLRDLSVRVPYADHQRRVERCLDDSLRTVLTPYVAPPALLHVTGDRHQRRGVLGPVRRRPAADRAARRRGAAGDAAALRAARRHHRRTAARGCRPPRSAPATATSPRGCPSGAATRSASSPGRSTGWPTGASSSRRRGAGW